MTYLPDNRVRLVAAWAPPEWIGALGTVRECASSTLVGAPGMLYLVEWDTLIVERTVMRDDDIESERSESYAGTYEDDRDDVLGVAQFGAVPLVENVDGFDWHLGERA
jgi:hypothetical protein